MYPVLLLTILGVLLALAIGLVVRYFDAPEDAQGDAVRSLMPGANCGGCGFAGCNDYASALLRGEAKPGACHAMSAENLEKLCRLLGVAQEAVGEPLVAVVCCSGDDNHAVHRAFYNGVNDCLNAVLVAGGAKGCSYGCLGLGSCARVCPFGAIEIRPDHIAKIHPDLCRGCGKCVSICPRKVIKLVPRSVPVMVYCSSPNKFAMKKQFCSAACIGCRKCQKASGEDKIFINGFLASVNTEDPPDASIVEVCPAKCLRTICPPTAEAAESVQK